MWRTNALYTFILENFWPKCGLKLLFRMARVTFEPQCKEKICIYSLGCCDAGEGKGNILGEKIFSK